MRSSLALSLVLTSVLWPCIAIADSLCTESKIAYFSCKTKSGKLISLCGRPLTQSRIQSGYLQYRFGTKNQLKMIFPPGRTEPVKKFTGAYFTPAGASYASISFTSGAYNYSISMSGGEGVREFSGVEIMRDKKVISSVPCSSQPTLAENNGVGFIEIAQRLSQ